MGVENLIFVAAVVLAAAGAGLLWVGWRGKRIDDHPICRKCGFDLFNKPAESKVCPECGVTIVFNRGVVFGHKIRGMGRFAAGTVTLVIGLAVLLLFCGP